jgi:hypothetical protein
MNYYKIGIRFLVGAEVFLLSTVFRPAMGPAQSPVQWIPMATSPRLRWPEEAPHHLYSSSSYVNNSRDYRPKSTTVYALTTLSLRKYINNLNSQILSYIHRAFSFNI